MTRPLPAPRRTSVRAHRLGVSVSRFAALTVVVVLAGCSSSDTSDSSSSTDPSTGALAPVGALSTEMAASWGDLANCELGPQTDNASAKPAPEKVDGAITFGKSVQSHVDGCVDYPMRPAVGGAHHPVWANCGFYTSPVPDEMVVHVLEHGGVSIAMDPTLDTADITRIREAVSATTHVIAYPYPGLQHKIVLSAWDRQLSLDSTSDPRFAAFIDTFLQGPNTPEPGAACSGGEGTPT